MVENHLQNHDLFAEDFSNLHFTATSSQSTLELMAVTCTGMNTTLCGPLAKSGCCKNAKDIMLCHNRLAGPRITFTASLNSMSVSAYKPCVCVPVWLSKEVAEPGFSIGHSEKYFVWRDSIYLYKSLRSVHYSCSKP